MSRAVRETLASAVRVRYIAQPEAPRASHPKRAGAPPQGAPATIEDAGSEGSDNLFLFFPFWFILFF